MVQAPFLSLPRTQLPMQLGVKVRLRVGWPMCMPWLGSLLPIIFPYPGVAEGCVDKALATQTHSNEQMMEKLHMQETVLAHSLALLTNMPPVA